MEIPRLFVIYHINHEIGLDIQFIFTKDGQNCYDEMLK